MAGPASTHAPLIYTVPPGRPFLTCLAEAILAGDLPGPSGAPPDLLMLPDITLLMPTRRATRALQEAFLAAGGGQAMLLPAIRPISEADEELSLVSALAGLTSLAASARDIAPAISELERRLTLTQLVMAWSRSMRDAAADDDAGELRSPEAGAGTPAQAAMLAADLARLMDLVETEGASFDNIDKLVGGEHAQHWEKTVRFLKIVTTAWPGYLAASQRLSPMDRRNRLILAEARRLAERPPSAPVIVAGVTGSIPATAELMRSVASLANGAIVLPALDLDLDEQSWQAIAPADEKAEHHPEHPQYGLKRLLDRLGLTRRDVRVLGDRRPAALKQRHALISEAMRPAATTGRWHDYVEHADEAGLATALDGLSLIEAPGAQDEAEVVALILREAAETPGRTAALVSPDRLLARRVAVRLEAWGIRVDDSAGRPFPKTVPGAFLDLVVGAVTHDFAPPQLMALLKHPLTRLGLDPFAARRAARALEVAAFRAPYLGRGIEGVEAALQRAEATRAEKRGSRALMTLWQQDLDNARQLVSRLAAALAPLRTLYAARGPQPLRQLLAAHLLAAEAMVEQPLGPDGKQPPSELYLGEAGQAAAELFKELTADGMPSLEVAPADYADLYRSLVATLNVRPKIPVHPRLFIWGPLEARLQQADVLVLGSLNDGTWPESADPGPWLNRPMRAELGLPAPEEKIGYAAHDFVTLAGAPRVFLTRAVKVDGVPTVESRWLLRLKSLLAALGLSDRLQPAEPWLGWALNRDEAKRTSPLAVPEPRPPLSLRPRKLSVSAIETWIANPYAIYASRILKLEALPVLGTSPDAALRGAVVHEALARFAKTFPGKLPGDARQRLIGFARDVLEEYTGHPRVAAFWLPRLERFADWFVETEPKRRAGVTKIAAELSGTLSFAAPGGPFTLTARADRLDMLAHGIVITDYKTGAFPNDKRVTQGEAPQLPLEAAIAAAQSGFDGFSPARVAGLRYIRASGGEPAGEQHDVKCDDIAALAAATVTELQKLVARFDDEGTAYMPMRRARFTYDYDDYAHLARVAEWSAGGGDEGGGEA